MEVVEGFLVFVVWDALCSPVGFFERDVVKGFVWDLRDSLWGMILVTRWFSLNTDILECFSGFVVGAILLPPWVSLKRDGVEGFSGFAAGDDLGTPVGFFDFEEGLEVSLWGMTLVPPRGSLKMMLWRGFQYSLWGMFLVPPSVSLKRMMCEDFEGDAFGSPVGLFERDLVEGF